MATAAVATEPLVAFPDVLTVHKPLPDLLFPPLPHDHDSLPILLPPGATVAKLHLPEHQTGTLVNFTPAPGVTEATWCLGQPKMGRFVSLHRFKLWWVMPTHGASASQIPVETALLLGEAKTRTSDGQQQYLLFVPLIEGGSRCVLNGAADNTLQIYADTGDLALPLPELVPGLMVVKGTDPFVMIRSALATVRTRVRADRGMANPEEPKGEQVSKFVDSFGWCTWDSFYTMVSPEGITEGLTTFNANGIKPRWVIVDDGWQSTTNDDALNGEQWGESLDSIKANKRFRHSSGDKPVEMGDMVKAIKEGFGVKNVFAWHALAGYWSGVNLKSAEIQKYGPVVSRNMATKGIDIVDPEMQRAFDRQDFGFVPAEHALSFYKDYHGYLKSQGIDGVKVDVQSILDAAGTDQGGVGAIAAAYHKALEESVTTIFKEDDQNEALPANMIHCMSHAPSVMDLIGAIYKGRPVVRGSDDYYPAQDSSHGPHLYTNAFNALIMAHVGLHDWDMFQTRMKERHGLDKASWFHAASRAISGGPVYVSDKPGQHNAELLRKLVLEDGSVLRPRTNALPTLDCMFRDPQIPGGGLLQVWSENLLPGSGVVGSFNVRGATFSQAARNSVFTEEEADLPGVHGQVRPMDVHALRGAAPGATYCMYLFRRHEVFVRALEEPVSMDVKPFEYELATVASVQTISKGLQFAALGLADMFNTGGATTSQEVAEHMTAGKASTSVTLEIKGSGRYMACASKEPHKITMDTAHGSEVLFHRWSTSKMTPSAVLGAEANALGLIDITIPTSYTGTPRKVVIWWN